VLLLLALWETAARSGLVSPLIIPRLESIALAFAAESVSGALLSGTARSLVLICAGLACGTLLALILTACAYANALFRSFLEVLVSIFHPLPGIALLPLVLLVFGVGTWPVLAIILHSVLWPLCVNLLSGFDNTEPLYSRIGQNYELSFPRFFLTVMIPASFPSILSGFKIAWARAWRALLSAEMLFGVSGGRGGLGWYVFNRRVFMDTPGMYAGLLMLILIGFTVETVFFGRLEKRTLLRWNVPA